ncbi:hypothetical protein CR513_19274, partial [Mucuna pruriens]
MTFRKEFKVGQKVLLFNSHLKLIIGNLRSKWDGSFVIINVLLYGTVEIRDEATDNIFKVDGHQLKPFHESPTVMKGDVDDLSLVKSILQKALKVVTRARFVPPTYIKDLHDRLQRLYQGTRSVEEYHKEMEMNLVRAQIRESDEVTMTQFLYGLNREVQDVVEL